MQNWWIKMANCTFNFHLQKGQEKKKALGNTELLLSSAKKNSNTAVASERKSFQTKHSLSVRRVGNGGYPSEGWN